MAAGERYTYMSGPQKGAGNKTRSCTTNEHVEQKSGAFSLRKGSVHFLIATHRNNILKLIIEQMWKCESLQQITSVLESLMSIAKMLICINMHKIYMHGVKKIDKRQKMLTSYVRTVFEWNI